MVWWFEMIQQYSNPKVWGWGHLGCLVCRCSNWSSWQTPQHKAVTPRIFRGPEKGPALHACFLCWWGEIQPNIEESTGCNGLKLKKLSQKRLEIQLPQRQAFKAVYSFDHLIEKLKEVHCPLLFVKGSSLGGQSQKLSQADDSRIDWCH